MLYLIIFVLGFILGKFFNKDDEIVIPTHLTHNLYGTGTKEEKIEKILDNLLNESTQFINPISIQENFDKSKSIDEFLKNL